MDTGILVPAALPQFTAPLLRELIGARHGVRDSGDYGFADDGESALRSSAADLKTLKPAAVLVLFIERQHGPSVLFTQRTAHLTDHAGQISFPGGRVEEGDAHVAATALRETAEETGIDVSGIDIVGELPCYTTGTGYRITPVVGWAPPVDAYRPDPTEVAECFEVPARFLTDTRNHRVEQAMYKGRMRSYYAIPYMHRYIWGATAGMLVSLTRVLYAGLGIDAGAPVRAAADSGG
ncbi:MAG: CoA pyrophosphatase [Betaproteobacteria bacterium]|nr:CoA pyrophosphatase [Betaproteobacteria bacterium]